MSKYCTYFRYFLYCLCELLGKVRPTRDTRSSSFRPYSYHGLQERSGHSHEHLKGIAPRVFRVKLSLTPAKLVKLESLSCAAAFFLRPSPRKARNTE